MDTTAENIRNVVGILTAILSEQEELAYEMVLESDPIELFSCLTGILLSALNAIADSNGRTIQDYLEDLGMSAFKSI